MVELIGFGISLLALVFLYFKNRQALSQRQRHIETIEEDEEAIEEDPLQALMLAMQKEKEKRERKHQVKPRPLSTRPKQPPPPPRQTLVQTPKTVRAAPEPKELRSPLEDYRLQSTLEKRKVKSALEERRLKSTLTHRSQEVSKMGLIHSHLHEEEDVSPQPSRIELAMRRLAHLPDLIIYQEVLSRPKGLRSDPWR